MQRFHRGNFTNGLSVGIRQIAGLAMLAFGVGVTGAAQAQSQVRELPIGADYCAILRAFTDAEDAKCPEVPAGPTRSTGNAATASFSKAAAPLSAAAGEKGYFIRFAFNSIDLTPEYKAHLDRLSTVFNSAAMEGVCVKLVGHTDLVGSEEYNQRLSVARARVVEAYLKGKSSLGADRMLAGGMGETKPLLNIPGGHPLNRRVEILAKAQNGQSCG